jgi:hypothetical protein
MRKFTPHVVLALLLCGSVSAAFAQTTPGADAAQLSPSFLKQVNPHTAHRGEIEAKLGPKFNGNGPASAAPTSGMPGFDTIINWSDQFTEPGFDGNNNPQSVWPYTMVGQPPEANRTTSFNAPVIPMTVDLLAADGTVAMFKGHPLTLAATPAIVKAVVNSPIFQPFIYPSGIGQFNDQLMRTQFWDRIHHGDGDFDADDRGGFHDILRPDVDMGRRIQIPFGHWFFGADAAGNPRFFLVDVNTFVNEFLPPAVADNTTTVGAAELSGEIKTRDISSFLFNNIYLYDTVPQNCCILGFHTVDVEPGDSKNGNRTKLFVLDFASWIGDGLFVSFDDVTAFSHEMSETFADPLVNNATPWWLAIDPVLGAPVLCQNNLENGDVIEAFASNPVFSITMHGRTYHPQNVATFSWFAFQSPSHALNGAYSFPDETTLPALSPANLHAGCAP